MNISVLMFIYGNELCCSGKILQPSTVKKKKAIYKCCVFYLYAGKDLKLIEKG